MCGLLVADGHRLRRVLHDVEHDLRQLLRIGVELRDADVEVLRHEDRGKLGLHDAAHAHEDLVDVGAPVGGQPARRQQAIDQRLQPVRLADDHLRVLGELRLRSSSPSRSCAAPRMPPSGFLISCARLRIRSRLACCCSSSRSSRAIFSCWSMWRNSISSVAVVRLDRRHRAGEVQLALPADAELDLLLGVRRAAQHGLADGARERRAFAEELARRVAEELLSRELEQVFGGWIHVGHAFVGAQHQHRRGKQFQPGIARDVRRCRRREEAELQRRRPARAHAIRTRPLR